MPEPRLLTADELAAIREHDGQDMLDGTMRRAYGHRAIQDRHALLGHISALPLAAVHHPGLNLVGLHVATSYCAEVRAILETELGEASWYTAKEVAAMEAVIAAIDEATEEIPE